MRRGREIRQNAASVAAETPERAWLPEPAEEIEDPQALDDPDEPARAGASFASGSGGGASRFWWRGMGFSAVVAVRDGRRDAGAVATLGRLSLAAGALAAPGMGLVGERSRLTRGAYRASLAAVPREALRAAWGSGADANGAAVSWTGPSPGGGGESAGREERRFAARLVGGSRARAEGPILAGEIRAPLGAASAVTLRAARWREGAETARPVARAAAGLGGAWRRGPAHVTAEIARDAIGLHADLAAGAREGAFGAAARWRRRAGTARSGGLDLEAGWGGRFAAARLRWRAWSAGGGGIARDAYDDGRAELDVRAGRGGPGTSRLRLGVKPRGAASTSGERLAIADIVAARERGRALRLFASMRATRSGSAWRYGRTLGASLRLERGRRGAVDLRAEAVRAQPNAAAAGSAFEIAGTGSLRSRTRNGVRLAARGWVALGAWRVGAAIDDEETTDTTRPRAPRASLWLTWNDAPGAP